MYVCVTYQISLRHNVNKVISFILCVQPNDVIFPLNEFAKEFDRLKKILYSFTIKTISGYYTFQFNDFVSFFDVNIEFRKENIICTNSLF